MNSKSDSTEFKPLPEPYGPQGFTIYDAREKWAHRLEADRRPPITAKYVGVALAYRYLNSVNFEDTHGHVMRAYPTIHTLAHDLGVAKRETISDAINELARWGYLLKVKMLGGLRGFRYDLYLLFPGGPVPRTYCEVVEGSQGRWYREPELIRRMGCQAVVERVQAVCRHGAPPIESAVRTLKESAARTQTP